MTGFAFTVLYLCIAQDLDVGMTVAFHEFRRLDAHGAVVGWKRFVELRHVSADAGLLFDQIGLEPGGAEIQGRLNTADAAPYDQHVSEMSFIQGVASFLNRFSFHGFLSPSSF
jgi:hypothetical protein